MNCIENEQICLKVSPHGAEMHSLLDKADGREYLWQGDVTYWKWHAPVCFPIVGVVHDGMKTLAGKEVNLTVHGFARDRDFQLIRQGKDTLVYELRSDEATLALYPYKFAFRISYHLNGKAVEVSYEVDNMDEQPIFFSVGGHTAFRCSVDAQGEFVDMKLVFSKEPMERYYFEGEFIAERKEKIVLQNLTLPLRQALFSKGVLAFRQPASKSVQLLYKGGQYGVQVDFSDFPYMGIWTKSEGAPFVCIEPWYGVTDGLKQTTFEEKEGLCRLAIGEKFSTQYTITIK